MNYDIRKIIGKYLLPNITLIKENKQRNLIELLNNTFWIKYNMNLKSVKYEHKLFKNKYDFWIIYD